MLKASLSGWYGSVPCAELVVECEADQSELSGLQRLGGRAAAAPHHRAHAASRAEDQIPLSTRGGAGRGTAAFCVHGHLPLGHGVTPASSGGGCQHHVATYLSPVNVQYIYFIKLWALFVVVIASPFFGKIMTSKRISFIGLQKIIQSDN